MPKTSKPEVGKTYRVNHSRKGTFDLRVTCVEGEWITGVIVDGRAEAMLDYNERETGESITIRRCLATFQEAKAA